MQKLASAVALMATLSTPLFAQTIERVKMSDNELTCQQIYSESNAMEGIVLAAGQQNASALAATRKLFLRAQALSGHRLGMLH